MKPHLFQSFVALAVVSSMTGSAVAAPLTSYRSCQKLGDENVKAVQRLVKIRQALGTNGNLVPQLTVPIFAMQFPPPPAVKPRRQSFSNYFRDLARSATERFHHEVRYQSPESFSPAQSIDEFREVSKAKQDSIILGYLNSKSRKAKVNGPDGRPMELWGMDALLSDLVGYVILAQKETDAYAWVPIPQGELELRDRLQGYFSKAGVNSAGESVFDILGKLHDTEIREGQIDEIHFTNDMSPFSFPFLPQAGGFMDANVLRKYYSSTFPDSEKVSLTLDMLLNLRTGREDAFVAVQETLVHYLERQREVFGRRRAQLTSMTYEFKKYVKAFKNINALLLTHQAEIFEYFSGNKAAATASIAQAMADMIASDPEMAFANQVNEFLEGRVKYDGKDELKFIEGRMNKIDIVMGTLHQKLSGTLTTHQKIARLNTKQVAYLIDFFLQAKGSEILTRKESANLAAYFENKGGCVAGATSADYPYFRNTSRLLSELEETLTIDAARSIAKEKDLEEIRSGS